MLVGIIGCGLIGKKRALSLSEEDNLIACCDTNEALGADFAKQFNCKYYKSYADLLKQTNCEAVIIAVVNKFASEIVVACLTEGIHVIAEKPLGRNKNESHYILSKLEEGRKSTGKHIVLKTGFNHRFHPAVWKAKELLDAATIGDLLTIRARYGHGGRAGMENEWRASKDLCGGGELLDQGVHVIDLCRWFANNIKQVWGKAKTKFWQMEVEDNAFVYMQSAEGVDIQFHVSWTNWKNIFSFEIFGSKGYLSINGLGGSYGTESLEIGLRPPQGGKPDVEVIQYPEEDISWIKEWAEFKKSIEEKREPIGNGFDGHRANEIINAIYESSATSALVLL